MPRKPKKERVPCQYFGWLLGTRSNGVFYADGRGNTPNLGRHSLGTRVRKEAVEALHRLDLVQAVEFGLADSSLLKQDRQKLLSLEQGRKLYLEYVERPLVQGGVSPATCRRYKPVLDKFFAFVEKSGIRYWQQVTKDVIARYGRWLEDEDYGYATQYFEQTFLKSVVKWMVGEELLPTASLIRLKLKKPQGTTTRCYTRAEVQAVVEFCRGRTDLHWLADVIVALVMTGLRINELAGLRWGDVDLGRKVIQLTDTTRRVSKSKRKEARRTKNHRDRSLAIHAQLLAVFERLAHAADGRVFHGPKGGILKPDTVRIVLKREVLAALAARFPPDGDDPGIVAGTVHGFRHYFCSVSADEGAPERLLMSWLGHQDSKMIARYYHAQEGAGRQYMSKIRFLDDPDTPGLKGKQPEEV